MQSWTGSLEAMIYVLDVVLMEARVGILVPEDASRGRGNLSHVEHQRDDFER